MRRAFTLVVLVSLAQLGVLVSPLPAASVRSGGPACGETITTDTVLLADLTDCPDSGIVIGADDITLDLNGHTIDGDFALLDPCPDGTLCDLGVDNSAGHSGVTVVGGTVKEFGFGVVVGGADENVLSRVTTTDNVLSGILVFESVHLRIEHNTITRNGLDTDFSGIAAFAMRDGLIAHSRIADNGDIGLYAEGIDGNVIDDNTMFGNPEAGMLFDGAGNVVSRNRLMAEGDGIVIAGDNNVVSNNRIAVSPGCPECGYGISFEGGSRNLFERNVISGARWGIRIDAFTGLASDSTVRRNVVRGSLEDNIVVDREQAGSVENTLVQDNTVVGAGDDGIDVRSRLTTISGNVALRNHDLGIEAVPGVIDGGGNHAAANGNRQQCTNVTC